MRREVDALRTGTDAEILAQFVVGNQAPNLAGRTITVSAVVDDGAPFSPDVVDFNLVDGLAKIEIDGTDLTAGGGELILEFTIEDDDDPDAQHFNAQQRPVVIRLRDPFEDTV